MRGAGNTEVDKNSLSGVQISGFKRLKKVINLFISFNEDRDVKILSFVYTSHLK
jgi:hypothetical protein